MPNVLVLDQIEFRAFHKPASGVAQRRLGRRHQPSAPLRHLRTLARRPNSQGDGPESNPCHAHRDFKGRLKDFPCLMLRKSGWIVGSN